VRTSSAAGSAAGLAFELAGVDAHSLTALAQGGAWRSAVRMVASVAGMRIGFRLMHRLTTLDATFG
jgi:hypothetical protein